LCELSAGVLRIIEWFERVHSVCGWEGIGCIECDMVFFVCGWAVFVPGGIIKLCVVRGGNVFEYDWGDELFLLRDGFVFG